MFKIKSLRKHKLIYFSVYSNIMEEEGIVEDFSDIFEDDPKKIMVDTYVLTPDYLPKYLIGRKKELKELAQIFRPMYQKGKPLNALVFGKSGTGKTVVVRFLLKIFMQELQEKQLTDHKVVWAYILCKNVRGENAVLYDIIRQIDPYTKIPKTGLELNFYYEALYVTLTDKNLSLIVVLDEIDYLKGDGLLYNFSRAGENRMGEVRVLPERHFITTIGISNDLKYGEGDSLDSRVISSMRFNDYVLDPYDSQQLQAILKERAKLAFKEGAVLESTIDYCAALSAKEHGDARKAIDLLKFAVIYAEEHGLEQVFPQHVDRAIDGMAIDRISNYIGNFPLHDKLVLLAIIKNIGNNQPFSTASAVTATYKLLCKEIDERPRHRTTVSNKFGEFETAGIIKEAGKIRKGKGSLGRDIELDVPSKQALEELLYNDERLMDLRDVKPSIFLNKVLF
jgi:archaeal cell division control protein 6